MSVRARQVSVEQQQVSRQQESQARRQQVSLGLQRLDLRQSVWRREQKVQRVCLERLSFPIEPTRPD
ncbi:MAG TPA: hypothetical protein VIX37_06885 [Candidatus Sulfotelmatobacter sp.]